jgi:hypothetical protein
MEMPNYAYSAKRTEIEALLYGLQQSDGWTDNRGLMHYASVSKQLTDGVQALMQLVGWATGRIYHKRLNRKMDILGRECNVVDQYWSSQRSSRKYSITNGSKEFLPQRIAYDGMVYCLTVSNGTLIVRRNGSVLVCGNCVDTLRYAAIHDIDHVDKKKLRTTRQGNGGY